MHANFDRLIEGAGGIYLQRLPESLNPQTCRCFTPYDGSILSRTAVLEVGFIRGNITSSCDPVSL